MKRHWILVVALAFPVGAGEPETVSVKPGPGSPLKLATFDLDATPPIGSRLAYDPVQRLGELGLRCRGVVLLGEGKPVVLCAVDWIGVANGSQDAFRDAVAEAATTTRERVAVHAVHQHDAPHSDFDTERLLQQAGAADLGCYAGSFQRQVIRRAAEAVRESIGRAETITQCAWGEAEVKDVASNRRIPGSDGRIRATRYTATKDPALRAEPAGVIDPMVSVLSFWHGDRPVAVLSYYACHPQSYYRTGVPSPDFPGIARFIRGQGVPEALHVHFCGAGGNIGAGKYNDGSKENRMALAGRLADAMKQAFDTSRKFAVLTGDVAWSSEPIALPPGPHLVEAKLRDAMTQKDPRLHLAAASQLAFLLRCREGRKIDIACLGIGPVRVLHMPGELFVEYQIAAKKMRPDLRVAMAAYGEYGTGYIGTAAAYAEGGYETSERATNVGADAEVILLAAMRRLLKAEP